MPCFTRENSTMTDRQATAHGHSSTHTDRPARGKALALLAVGALGIVYGGIGTSPLYALRECFSGHFAIKGPESGQRPRRALAHLLVADYRHHPQVCNLYLSADNGGEGGIMALTALASPLRRIAMSRQRWLVLLGVFGAALLYGDGVITPAISVLSAVEGLKIVTPLFRPYVVPITVVILIALFAIQSRGTARIGGLFGPIMIAWFAVLAVLGITHIVQAPRCSLPPTRSTPWPSSCTTVGRGSSCWAPFSWW